MILTIITTTFTISLAVKPVPPPGPTLNPKTIPKYTQQLVIPPYYDVNNVGGVDTYTIRMVSGINQQILPPPFPTTPTWAYEGPLNGNPFTLTRPH